MYRGRGRGRGWGPGGGFKPHFVRPQSNLSKTNVYIRGLPPEANDVMLVDLCQKYGDIVSVKAVCDMRTNICRGYGFVMFAHEEQAKNALTALIQAGFDASMARDTERTRDSTGAIGADFDPTSIYIYCGLPTTIDDMQLASLFFPFGSVLHARVLRRTDGSSRGVGFVRLDTPEGATRAIQSLAGTWLQGATCAVELRNAESKAAKESRRSRQGLGPESDEQDQDQDQDAALTDKEKGSDEEQEKDESHQQTTMHYQQQHHGGVGVGVGAGYPMWGNAAPSGPGGISPNHNPAMGMPFNPQPPQFGFPGVGMNVGMGGVGGVVPQVPGPGPALGGYHFGYPMMNMGLNMNMNMPVQPYPVEQQQQQQQQQIEQEPGHGGAGAGGEGGAGVGEGESKGEGVEGGVIGIGEGDGEGIPNPKMLTLEEVEAGMLNK